LLAQVGTQQGKKKERKKKTCHHFEFPHCFFATALSFSCKLQYQDEEEGRTRLYLVASLFHHIKNQNKWSGVKKYILAEFLNEVCHFPSCYPI